MRSPCYSERAGQAVSALLDAPGRGLEELRRHVRLHGPRRATQRLTALMA
ncbi:hypothetical protein [Streptomyces sp. NPDC093514]